MFTAALFTIVGTCKPSKGPSVHNRIKNVEHEITFNDAMFPTKTRCVVQLNLAIHIVQLFIFLNICIHCSEGFAARFLKFLCSSYCPFWSLTIDENFLNMILSVFSLYYSWPVREALIVPFLNILTFFFSINAYHSRGFSKHLWPFLWGIRISACVIK